MIHEKNQDKFLIKEAKMKKYIFLFIVFLSGVVWAQNNDKASNPTSHAAYNADQILYMVGQKKLEAIKTEP